jgi:hypothetical protein
VAELTNEQREALDYLVDMARGHDYAEIAKISEAESVIWDALTGVADMLAEQREQIAAEIEALTPFGKPKDYRFGYAVARRMAARIAREVPDDH